MRFADPQACPECRGAIAGQPACPHCGLDLTSVEVRQLWQLLLQADELLQQASRRRVASAPPAGPQPPPPAPAPAAQPPPVPTPQRRRSWSVGTVLLVLGAFGLVVAGLIFVTRSWEDIGLAGRTLILLGVTAIIGALGAWVTVRPLRASAEAVWAVFLALTTLDFFAARHQDLLGLRSLDPAAACFVWGIVLLALGVGIALWARPHVAVALVAPAVAGGIGIAMAGVGAGALVDDLDFAWRAVIALVAAGLLALATRPAGLAPMTLTARIVLAGFFAAAYVSAFVELVDHPALDDLVGGAHGIPMILMALASVVVAWLVPVVRIPGMAVAVFAASAVVITPVADGGTQEATWVVIAALAAVLAAAGARGSNDWIRGFRLGTLPLIGAVALLHAGLLGETAETIERILEAPWPLSWDDRLDALTVDDHAAWAVLPVLVALLVAAWFVPRWPGVSALKPPLGLVMFAAAGLGAVEAVVALRLPVWAVAGVLLAVVLGALVLHLRDVVTSASPVALAVVLAAATLAAASQGVASAAWLFGAAILAGFAYASGPALLRQGHTVAAVGLTLAGLAVLADLADLDAAVTVMLVLAAALALLAVAGLLLGGHLVRVPLEGTAAAGALVALVVPGDTTVVAVRWTLAGAVLIALSLAAAGRRWYAWPGIASLVIAYVLLIVDSGFSFVEAYTLPLGAVALAIGLHLARRRPGTSTWVLLGPGLALAMLPSVPQALVDPTDLRALLLGAGAVVALLLGVRLGWQAPFAMGATIVASLLLFNIGPYANAAPRVVVIAVGGAVSLGMGITWEDRVRDGRKLAAYIRAMR